ncbi:MAG TPA: ABC transporter ATP-binding protein [Acidimicrobiia bacterium]|nr:ABC transporter ATP-binding protein [Acidimicrobiia bacterium]
MSTVIEVEGLRKEYRRVRGGRTVAVAGLDLAVPEGGVFGFLGPNGSGKTTTIRCLLGLVRPTSGSVSVLGADVPRGLAGVISRIGSIVETPQLFPTMTGRENLRLLGAIDRIGHRSVDAALARVGLAERADDAVRKYSLGMRQRIGLAAALLKDPALVVLDEPANGLDPAGIREIRELLRGLGAEGRTVFVSSHLLTEVEQTCDAVAIMNRGRCVASGSVREVLARGDRHAVLVRLGDLDAGLAVLRGAGYATTRTDGHLRVELPDDRPDEITRTLGERGLWVTDLRAEEASLEELFLEITGATEAGTSDAMTEVGR